MPAAISASVVPAGTTFVEPSGSVIVTVCARASMMTSQKRKTRDLRVFETNLVGANGIEPLTSSV